MARRQRRLRGRARRPGRFRRGEPGGAARRALALQWPIVTLGGVRRFYSRGGTRIPEWADRIALLVAIAATIAAWVTPLDIVTYAQVYALAAVALALYAAIAVARLEDFATSSTLRTLRLALIAGAIAQLAWLAVDVAYLGPLLPSPTPPSGRCWRPRCWPADDAALAGDEP